MRFSIALGSDQGLVRGNNEDAAAAGSNALILADGVGGSAAGEVASASSAFVFSTIAMSIDTHDLFETLSGAFAIAYEHLVGGVAADVTRAGMATTLTVIVTDGEQSLLGHVGDSRAYLMRGEELTRLSHDHTLVQELIDDGELTEADARHHPYKSVVTRSLNTSETPEPDLTPLDLRPGDRLLLASDGLSDMITDEEIATNLGVDEPDRAVTSLIQAALAAGGKDNVTCVVADVVDGPIEPVEQRWTAMAGAIEEPKNLIDAGYLAALS